jgi:hypothetical protein
MTITVRRTRRRRRFRPLRALGLLIVAALALPFLLTALLIAWYFVLGHVAVFLASTALVLATYTIGRVLVHTLRTLDSLRSVV